MRLTGSALVLIACAIALTTFAREKEEQGIFRLHEVFEQWDAKAKPTKVFGKHEMYNLGLEPKFDDEDVESARADIGKGANRLIIQLRQASAQRLREFTAQHRDRRIGIVIKNKLIEAPKIAQPIENGEIVVTMSTALDAEVTAKILQAIGKAVSEQGGEEQKEERGKKEEREKEKERQKTREREQGDPSSH